MNGCMLSDVSEQVESRVERKERTRQALLEGTLALAADRGFAALSLREIARSAGIVPTAFYRHFASLDELGTALVDEGCANCAWPCGNCGARRMPGSPRPCVSSSARSPGERRCTAS